MATKTLEDLRPVLEHYPGVRQAIVFGSVARGAARTDSDLDIAIDTGKPLSAEQIIELIEKLAETTGRPVDMIDLSTVGEPLLGEILRTGTRILGSNTDYAKLLSRHLLDQADFMPYVDRMLAERRRTWIG